MLFSILRSGDPLEAFLSLLLTLPIMLLALSLHETAHGWVAWRCGDPTGTQSRAADAEPPEAY